MAMPAGWLASKLGYKGGIIAGLLIMAIGGFWFIPATKIATFPAFLPGVCVIASGLTFLETVANLYTTVLGPKQFAATRINLAQSCIRDRMDLRPDRRGCIFLRQGCEGREHRVRDPVDSGCRHRRSGAGPRGDLLFFQPPRDQDRR